MLIDFIYKTPLLGLALARQPPVRLILPAIYFTKKRQLSISDDDYAIVFQKNQKFQQIFVVTVSESNVHHLEYASCLHGIHNTLKHEGAREVLRSMLELLLENSTPDMVFSIQLQNDLDANVKMVFELFKFQVLHSCDASTTYRLGLF